KSWSSARSPRLELLTIEPHSGEPFDLHCVESYEANFLPFRGLTHLDGQAISVVFLRRRKTSRGFVGPLGGTVLSNALPASPPSKARRVDKLPVSGCSRQTRGRPPGTVTRLSQLRARRQRPAAEGFYGSGFCGAGFSGAGISGAGFGSGFEVPGSRFRV